MPSIVETLRSMADYLEQHRAEVDRYRAALTDAHVLLRKIRSRSGYFQPEEIDDFYARHAAAVKIVDDETAAKPAEPAHVPVEPPAPRPLAIGKPSVGRPRV